MKYATRQPIRDQKYLDWLKTQRCILTGSYGYDSNSIDPMHVGTRGKGLKSSDDEVLPVLHTLHQYGHNTGEITLLRTQASDSLLREAFRALARELYQEYKSTL